MTTGSGLEDKPPSCDSNKDGEWLIGERSSRLPPKLCSTFHLIYKLQVRGRLGISGRTLWNTSPALAWNANPMLAINCCLFGNSENPQQSEGCSSVSLAKERTVSNQS